LKNEAYDNRYVPKNCKVTVKEENGLDPSRTVRVQPEILHFARKGERVVVIENCKRECVEHVDQIQLPGHDCSVDRQDHGKEEAASLDALRDLMTEGSR